MALIRGSFSGYSCIFCQCVSACACVHARGQPQMSFLWDRISHWDWSLLRVSFFDWVFLQHQISVNVAYILVNHQRLLEAETHCDITIHHLISSHLSCVCSRVSVSSEQELQSFTAWILIHSNRVHWGGWPIRGKVWTYRATWKKNLGPRDWRQPGEAGTRLPASGSFLKNC